MKIQGLELAPFKININRFLQKVAVAHFTFGFLFAGLGASCIFLYVLLFTGYFYIPLAYMVWYVYDRDSSRRGGKRCQWTRRWSLFQWSADYFPASLTKTADLPPTTNYIFACHPHGIMAQSHYVNFASEGTGFEHKFPGITPHLAVLAGMFRYPVFRDYLLLTGAIEASHPSIDWVLSQKEAGHAVCIMIGGAAEVLDAHPGSLTLKVMSRKGFCRKALKHGASLVPVFALGENELFLQASNPRGSWVRRLQESLVRVLGYSPALYHGSGLFNETFGLLPFRRPVHTIVGAPIPVSRVDEPSQQQICELHSHYLDCLNALFETHKKKYGYTDSDHLNFV